MLNKKIDYIKIAEQYQKERITKFLLVTPKEVYKAGDVEVITPTYTQFILD